MKTHPEGCVALVGEATLSRPRGHGEFTLIYKGFAYGLFRF